MLVSLVAGTRPNFVKIAPITKALRELSIPFEITHTGQHHDENLSKVFFDELRIPEPSVNLSISSPTPKDLRKKTAAKIADHLSDSKPTFVVVVGDSDATCAGAMGAKLAGIPLAHVEAGLRSFYMAMPEERNRIYIDGVADYLFVSEPSGIRNLKKVKAPGKIYYVGNVTIDSIVQNLTEIKRTKPAYEPKTYAVATIHRKSNVHSEKDLKETWEIINFIAEKFIKLVMPIHPRTAKNLKSIGLTLSPNIDVIPPLGYIEFQSLLYNSKFAVTDSGGLQDETTYYGVPCITMRQNTERPITAEIGTSVLVGRDRGLIVKHIQAILSGKFKNGRIPKFWDGKASDRIAEILSRILLK